METLAPRGARYDDVMSGGLPSRRPRFAIVSRLPPAELARRVQRFIQTSDRVRGLAQEARIELAIGGDEHHFWSPQLVATVRAEPDGRAHLDARFGPDPYVWVLYLLAYMALSVTTLIALAFGFSQVLLKQPPTALYFAPVAAVLAAIVYGASYVGQGLGSDQMYFLRTTLKNLAEAEDEADRGSIPAREELSGEG